VIFWAASLEEFVDGIAVFGAGVGGLLNLRGHADGVTGEAAAGGGIEDFVITERALLGGGLHAVGIDVLSLFVTPAMEAWIM